MRRNKGWKLAAGVVAMSLVAVACGGDDEAADTFNPSATECAELKHLHHQTHLLVNVLN
jgi:ABC-type glycerol-3-phosphate transport system substrate-binding protein